MMTKTILYCLAIAGLAVVLAANLPAQNSNSQPGSAAPRQWQHLALPHEGKSITGDRELAEKINQLGSDGWELVDVETMTDSGITVKTVFFFKRTQ